MVTKDEVADPQALGLWLEVNGRRFQDGSTRTMIFTVAKLVSYISEFMSLLLGDIISTGTPPGVGLGQKPPPLPEARRRDARGHPGPGRAAAGHARLAARTGLASQRGPGAPDQFSSRSGFASSLASASRVARVVRPSSSCSTSRPACM